MALPARRVPVENIAQILPGPRPHAADQIGPPRLHKPRSSPSSGNAARSRDSNSMNVTITQDPTTAAVAHHEVGGADSRPRSEVEWGSG